MNGRGAWGVGVGCGRGWIYHPFGPYMHPTGNPGVVASVRTHHHNAMTATSEMRRVLWWGWVVWCGGCGCYPPHRTPWWSVGVGGGVYTHHHGWDRHKPTTDHGKRRKRGTRAHLAHPPRSTIGELYCAPPDRDCAPVRTRSSFGEHGYTQNRFAKTRKPPPPANRCGGFLVGVWGFT